MLERSTHFVSEDSVIVTRRNILMGAAVTLICAPAIVRTTSLMPVRGIILPAERQYFGFVDRLYVHANLPTIIEFQNVGLSGRGVAAAMNCRGRTSINGGTWDALEVTGVLTRDKKIRQEDEIYRAETMPCRRAGAA